MKHERVVRAAREAEFELVHRALHNTRGQHPLDRGLEPRDRPIEVPAGQRPIAGSVADHTQLYVRDTEPPTHRGNRPTLHALDLRTAARGIGLRQRLDAGPGADRRACDEWAAE